MPTPPMAPAEPILAQGLHEAAIQYLRNRENPFTFSVATAGTQDNCRDYDVRGLLDSQRADVMAIVNLYRRPNQPSQVFPILGDTGTGKTHLLTVLQTDLQKEAEACGSECLLLVADHFSVGVDAIDFFFWQIINHLLAGKGPGKRLLLVISNRLTGRLLAEAIRQLAPHSQAELIPLQSLGQRVRNWFGSSKVAQARLECVRRLLASCDVLTSVEPRAACEEAGIPVAVAVRLIQEHLERTEPKDVMGILRREVYGRLVGLALADDEDSLQDYWSDGFLEGPANVSEAGQVTRRMLTVLLELFRALSIPVILVFDQLEDYLRAPSPDRERELRDTFVQGLAALMNNVAGLCLLVFAEEGLWNMVKGVESGKYARDRLDQEFNLPGRPARRAIIMPDRLPRKYLVELIERRMHLILGEFDSTGLSSHFPFHDEQVRELESEPTIRGCLRKLSRWYNELVYAEKQGKTVPPPLPDLRQKLQNRWEKELEAAKKIASGEAPRPALIPQVQNALQFWLIQLQEQGISAAADWGRVELLEDVNCGPYGYLTVLRADAPNAPGIGIAAWLAGNRGRAKELSCRLGFFSKKPCPIRTLIMFREEGEKALNGETKDIFDGARKKGRDVRIQSYESRHLESLLAFQNWFLAVTSEVHGAGPSGPRILKEYVEHLSKELLDWIEAWRRQRPGGES